MRDLQTHYKLEGHKVIKCDWLEWARMFRDIEAWRVGLDKIKRSKVSTVFLGIDHNWNPEGEPLLFETMIFGKADGGEEYQTRCSTWEQAEKMHKKAIRKVKKYYGLL